MIAQRPTARPRTQRCFIALFLALLFVAGASTQASAQRSDADRPKRAPDGEKRRRISPEGRKFFRSLSQEEKVKLRDLRRLLMQRSPERWPRLFERLRRLPAEKRLLAITRARKQILNRDPSRRQVRREWRDFETDLRHVEKEHRKKMQANLPTDLGKKLKDVDDPEDRVRIIRQHRRLRNRRTDLIKELPAELREHVKALPPLEQTRFLRGYRGYLLFKEVFSSDAERKRILQAKPRQLRRVLQQERQAPDTIQRPPFIQESSWQQWRSLKSYQRLRVLRTIIGIHRNGGTWSPPGVDGKRRDRAKPERQSKPSGE